MSQDFVIELSIGAIAGIGCGIFVFLFTFFYFSSRSKKSPTEKGHKEYILVCDERFDNTLHLLQKSFGKKSKAEVLQLANAMLHVAGEAQDKGLRVTLSDDNYNVVRTLMPSGKTDL